ncbi:TolC family protein [Dyella tabacisoli]|uniref:TolC family protein n=1 Tax=Dyella tabacisoli TaxID=2282381 RepID=UPI001CDC380F|nr:TolC family protein [Dyella tabacisoli]
MSQLPIPLSSAIASLSRCSNTHRALLLALSLSVLAGCAVAPLPELKPPVPGEWRNAPAGGVAAAPADLRGWWQALGDPELDALIARALKDNLDVAQATERLMMARGLNRHARDGYLPNLHAKTNDVINPDTSASYFVVGFDAQWELPLFGAWQSAQRVAQGQLNGAQAALHGAQVSLVAEVSRRWIELRSAQRQAQAFTAIRDAQREKLRLLQVRQQLQLAPSIEIAKAQAELARAEAALAEPTQTINASVQQLAVLVGQSEPDPQWLQPGPQPQLGQWQLASAPADLLRTRPEIASAEAEVLRAAGQLGLSRADMYPHIGIGTSLQWSVNTASNHRARTGEGIYSIGPIIDIPLFDWGQRVANAHAKDHELRAAVFAYRQAVLQGVAEAETALGNLEQLRLRELASQQVTQATEQGMVAMRKRNELGLASTLDMQDNLIEGQRTELELVNVRAARSLAYVALYKALGGAPLPQKTDAN